MANKYKTKLTLLLNILFPSLVEQNLNKGWSEHYVSIVVLIRLHKKLLVFAKENFYYICNKIF